jgi:hypothetical protein
LITAFPSIHTLDRQDRLLKGLMLNGIESGSAATQSGDQSPHSKCDAQSLP